MGEITDCRKVLDVITELDRLTDEVSIEMDGFIWDDVARSMANLRKIFTDKLAELERAAIAKARGEP